MYLNGKNIQNGHEIYQMAMKIPSGRKIDQMAIKYTNNFPLQDPLKFTQIWIFCLKLYHLATLMKKGLTKMAKWLPTTTASHLGCTVKSPTVSVSLSFRGEGRPDKKEIKLA
jgi:hypothetical protein